MMALLISLLLIAASACWLNTYISYKAGIKDALFYYRCEQNMWIAETAWLDGLTGRVCKIITTSHWQDGVVSVLSDGEKIYHTKQPCHTREGLHRYHRIARRQFFIHTKWRALASCKQHIKLSNISFR
jgi:hypothetical protein